MAAALTSSLTTIGGEENVSRGARGTLLGMALALLVLAAIDSLVMGAWACWRPQDLFAFLQTTGSPDALLLCRALGAIWIFQGVCLFFAVVRPAENGLVVLLPLSGRMLLCGVWLWLLGTDRVTLPADRLRMLLLHDAIWVPIFGGFLLVRPRAPSPSRTVKDTLPCLDSSSPWSSSSPQPHTVQQPPHSGSS
jgi:hypothetical protein